MVDWTNFNKNNGGSDSDAFEEMIYLLFCTKYDKKEGIFGYFNQRGIEKEPIKVNDECMDLSKIVMMNHALIHYY